MACDCRDCEYCGFPIHSWQHRLIQISVLIVVGTALLGVTWSIAQIIHWSRCQ